MGQRQCWESMQRLLNLRQGLAPRTSKSLLDEFVKGPGSAGHAVRDQQAFNIMSLISPSQATEINILCPSGRCGLDRTLDPDVPLKQERYAG